MPVASKRDMSQVQKDGPITNKENIFIYGQSFWS